MKKITKLSLSAVLLMGSLMASAQTETPNDSTSVELQEIVLVGSNAVMFRANVYNLLDEEYISQGDAYGYFYGNGTTWNASLQYRF